MRQFGKWKCAPRMIGGLWLIAPEVVNAMPEDTLRAFADHGYRRSPETPPPAHRDRPCACAQEASIDLPTLTAQLEREGVRFSDSYHDLAFVPSFCNLIYLIPLLW